MHELDNANATRMLLNAIETAGITNAKSDDYYLVVLKNDIQSEAYHITSGDPSRGTISLESHAAPTQDVQVQVSTTLVPAERNAEKLRSCVIFLARHQ